MNLRSKVLVVQYPNFWANVNQTFQALIYTVPPWKNEIGYMTQILIILLFYFRNTLYILIAKTWGFYDEK